MKYYLYLNNFQYGYGIMPRVRLQYCYKDIRIDYRHHLIFIDLPNDYDINYFERTIAGNRTFKLIYKLDKNEKEIENIIMNDIKAKGHFNLETKEVKNYGK